AERSRRGLSFDATLNQPPRIAALLHRHLCNPGQRSSTLLEGRRVADHEDLWMTGHGEIRLDADPAGAVRRRLEPLARRRRRDAGGPDHGPGRDALAAHQAATGVDTVNAATEPHLDAERLEATLRRGR